MTRASMLEVLSQDFVRTAAPRACRADVVVRHGLANAMIPIVTVIGHRSARCSAAPWSSSRCSRFPASAG